MILDPAQLGTVQLVLTAIYLSFFVVPHVIAAVLLVRNRGLLRKTTVATALLFVTGVIAFTVAPTDPPWMAASRDPSLGDVERLPRLVLFELGVEFEGASGTEQGYGFEPNALASMPSIHLGVTVIVAAVAWRGGTFWRLLACGYAVAMGITLVVSGEHYVLDVVAGALLAVMSWVFADRLGGDTASPPAPEAPERSDRRSVPEARLRTGRSFGRGTGSQSGRPIATSGGGPPRRGA
jgi:membrane-associated phospholipid phosphatase